MPADLRVSALRFAPATHRESVGGLIGFASFLLNGRVRIDGVGVRRKLDGSLTLSWPARTDRAGERHPLIRPIDDASRRDLEAQVLAALGLPGGAP